MPEHLFTSESVSEGHPDKIADQISDALVDAALRQGAGARAACETLVKDNRVVLAGEMRAELSPAKAESLAREVIRGIGYDDSALGFDADSCVIDNYIGAQSANIAAGVDEDGETLGAGDQGIMFGYACRETESLMPLAIDIAHRMTRRHAEARKNGALPWLRPDAKSQVSVRYRDGKPQKVEAVVFSTQHAPEIDGKTVQQHDARVREAVVEEIIKPAAGEWLAANCVFHVNPTGIFVLGGPVADCGLTGRKIIVDTYGGAAPHGGGAFSGKDPTKVDRSAAYALRHIAKSIVAAGKADRCLIQAAYAIGVAAPVSILVHAHGGEDEEKLSALVRREFDLTPGGIIKRLNLWRPIYQISAAGGHFGRAAADGFFPWES
ncbi:MAG: methionine adenosyltransferase, partial [Gammaproteobacteria bacterium]